jgi:ribose transport system ATP-binding protein
MIASELSELLTACDRILVMADRRTHKMLASEAVDDASVPADDTAHRLQAAECRLQIEIQKSLKAGQEASRV